MRKFVTALACVAAPSCFATLSGCADTFVAVRDEIHPAGGRCFVSATIEEWPHGYYSTAITIRNVTA